MEPFYYDIQVFHISNFSLAPPKVFFASSYTSILILHFKLNFGYELEKGGMLGS